MAVKNRFTKPERVQVDTGDKTKVQQQHKDQVDITKVVSRFQKTGQLFSTPGKAALEPIFGVWRHVDFQEAYQAVQDAKLAFQNLPPKVRSLFGNDPAEVVRFCENPANAVKAIKMGIMTTPEGYVIDEKAGVLVHQEDLLKAPPEGEKGGEVPNPS